MRFFFILTLLFAVTSARADDLKPYRLDNLTGGINTKAKRLPPSQCEYAKNVLFDEILGFKTRDGLTAVSSYPVAGKTCQAIWSLEKSNGEKYFIGSFEDSLYYTITFKSWTLIRSGLSWRLNPLKAAVFQDKIFFTNGINNVFYFDGSTHGGNLYGEIGLDSIKGKYIVSHNNKLFLANFYDNASKIRYNNDNSDATDANSWPEKNAELAGYEDGDIITGLHSTRNVLLIGKKYSMWGLFGYAWDDWEIHKINSDYGVWQESTIQDDKGGVDFLSNKGVIRFDGSYSKKIDKPVEDEIIGCNNLKGEYYYWQNTDSDDWNAGTSTGADITSQEISLQDKTKVWSSSNTYPTAFSTTTASGSPSNFNNTKIMNKSEIILTTTNNSTDTISHITSGLYAINYLRKELGTEVSNGYYDIICSNPLNLIDGRYDTVAILEDHNDNDAPKNFFAFKDNAGNSDMAYYRFIYDVTNTSKSITSCKFKFDFDIKDCRIYTTNFDGIIDVPLDIDINVYARKNNKWDKKATLTKIFNQEKSDFEYVKYEYRTNRDLYKLKDEFFRTLTFDATTEDDKITFALPFEADKIKFEVVFYTEISDIVPYISWSLSSKNFYEIELKGDTNYIPIYASTGTYTTEIHNFDNTGDPGLVYLSTFTASVINNYEEEGTTITFKIKTSSWSATLEGESWTDLNGDVKNGIKIPSDLSPCQYVQILSSFSTTQSSHTPTLQSISVGATKSSATWTSKKFNAGKVDAGWKYIVASDIKNGQTIDYSVRTATGSVALGQASWDSVSSGDLLDAAVHPSSHTWYQVKADLSTTDGRQIPILESITQTYCPEAEPVEATSASIDDRYYLAISTITDSTSNGLVRIYDKNGNWAQFTDWSPVGFAEYANIWYMAESNGIYKLSTATVDGTTVINTKWKKYMDFGLPNRDKQLFYVYISGKKTSGTYDFTYSIGDSTTTYSVTFDQSGSGFYDDKVAVKNHSSARGFYYTIESTSPVHINYITSYYKTEELR